MLHLVDKELTEVLNIQLCLGRIDHNDRTVEFYAVSQIRRLDGSYHIGELAHTGRLDHDTVRGKLCHDILKCRSEITYQRAADAAGVHLRDLDPGFF